MKVNIEQLYTTLASEDSKKYAYIKVSLIGDGRYLIETDCDVWGLKDFRCTSFESMLSLYVELYTAIIEDFTSAEYDVSEEKYYSDKIKSMQYHLERVGYKGVSESNFIYDCGVEPLDKIKTYEVEFSRVNKRLSKVKARSEEEARTCVEDFALQGETIVIESVKEIN